MTNVTTTRNFRENLKHYFDLARENPIAVNRGSERYVLLSEKEFVKMKEEVMNLQKSLISTMRTLHDGGEVECTDVDEHHKQILSDVLNEDDDDENKVAGE